MQVTSRNTTKKQVKRSNRYIRSNDHFSIIWRKFQNSTPESYHYISMEACRLFHGPELPEKAFRSFNSLVEWYRTVRDSWLKDVWELAELWQGRLPSQDHELALLDVVFEARNTGIRSIQRRIFRDRDDTPRNVPISTYAELSQWCDFMFELLDDDEQYVENIRRTLIFRFDKGAAYRLEEERKEIERKYDKFVAAMTYSMMKGLSKAKPRAVEPDDEWLLIIWSQLANPKETLREATVDLFVDTQPQTNQPHFRLLEDIVYATWKAMRLLGPVCRDEPRATDPKKVCQSLDTVKRFCTRQERRRPGNGCEVMTVSNVSNDTAGRTAQQEQELDLFIASANGEMGKKSFQEWAGNERVTLAIVFTDVVGSTALEEEIKSEAMKQVRRAHFSQSRKLIGRHDGREIKTIGDSFMAAFKCVDDALDYAFELRQNTGSPQIQIRAGIHIGPMYVEEGDVFGGTVNFAARVTGAIQGAEIWLSDEAKKDIDHLGAVRYKHLKWKRHEDIKMKGFNGTFALWAIKALS